MSARKAQAITLVFRAIDPNNRPAALSGITFAAGDAKVSLDGTAFASTTNAPAEIGSTGRYSISLVAAEMFADLVYVRIENANMDPVDIAIPTDCATIITVQAGGSGTAVISDRTEATDDYWKDTLLEIRSGVLAGQVKKCTSYTGSTKTFNFTSGFTGTPAAGVYAAVCNF